MPSGNLTKDNKVGLFLIQDSGVPSGSDKYKTLVVIHGFAWTSGTFSRISTIALEFNTRLILVSRRDYPGSAPLNSADRELLASCSSSSAQAAQNIRRYMKGQARELYDFLCELATTRSLPRASKDGGIILVGWSFGGVWITALLAHLETFEAEAMVLGTHIRKFILLDPPYYVFGFPHRPGLHTPVDDPSLTPGEGLSKFPEWVSAFYSHYIPPAFLSSPSANNDLEYSTTALSDPPATFITLSAEEIEDAIFAGPALPEGSDGILFEAGHRLGLFEELRKEALYSAAPDHTKRYPVGNGALVEKEIKWWQRLEVRVIWCDQSPWVFPWGIQALYKELEDAKAESHARAGEVNIVRMKGANHFPHWEDPQRALRALLVEDSTQEL